MEGPAVGLLVVGDFVGLCVGLYDGVSVGLWDGLWVGLFDGLSLIQKFHHMSNFNLRFQFAGLFLNYLLGPLMACELV